MPEDSHGFYAPIIGWVDGLRTDVSTGFSFEFHFEYLNTSSTKQVLQLLQAIDSQIGNLNHRITWMYDEGDRGMLKTGMLLQKLLKHPIEFREVQD